MPVENGREHLVDGPQGFSEVARHELLNFSVSMSGHKVGTSEDEASGDDVDKHSPNHRGQNGGLREHQTDFRHASSGDLCHRSARSFEELGLSPTVLKGIYSEMRFQKPSKIQAVVLPMILTAPYKDLIAQGQNGSGKTTSFVLAMLGRINPDVEELQAICVCPTREQTLQNELVLRRIGRYTSIQCFTTAVDDSFLVRGNMKCQVLMGTLGRLKVWFQRRVLDLSHVDLLVFDEADDMLKTDRSADESIRLIRDVRKRSPGVQLLLFGSAFTEYARGVAEEISPSANKVFMPRQERCMDVVSQYNTCTSTREAKAKALRDALPPSCEKIAPPVVCVRTREAARQLYNQLQDFLARNDAVSKIREALQDNKDVSRYIAQHMVEWNFPLGCICPHNIAPWLDQEPSSTLTKELERIMNTRIWRGKVCVKGRERPRTFFIFRLPKDVDELDDEDGLVELVNSCLVEAGRDKQAVENARLHIGNEQPQHQQHHDTSQQSSTSMVRGGQDYAGPDNFKESDATSEADGAFRVVTRQRANRKSSFAHPDDTLDSMSVTVAADSCWKLGGSPFHNNPRTFADHDTNMNRDQPLIGIPKIYERDVGKPATAHRPSPQNQRTAAVFKDIERPTVAPSNFQWNMNHPNMSTEPCVSSRNLFSSRKRPAESPLCRMQSGLDCETSMMNKNIRTNRSKPRTTAPSVELKVQNLLAKVLKLSAEELLTAKDATEVLQKMRSSPCNCCFYDRRPIPCQCSAYSP